MLAVLQYLNTVNEHVLYTGRVLMGVFECREVLHCVRVEYDDVSEEACGKLATIPNTDISSGL